MPKAVALNDAYTPREWAKPFHRSRAKRKVVWAHRRAGKGWAALFEGLAAYRLALMTPSAAELVPGFHAWTVAPSFPQARQSESELEAFLPEWARPPMTAWDTSRGHSKAEHTFTIRGSQHRREGLWEVKSAHEPEALQTVGLDFLHVEECQDIAEAAFQKLLPTLRSPGRMGLSVWEGIPPDDPGHWFARLLAEAESKESETEAFIIPYTQNPDLPDDIRQEIESDIEVMLEREWRRMYLCELPSGEGSFLGNVDGCISNLPLLDAAESQHHYVMGVDLAKKVDFTVIIVMDACHRRVVWQRRINGMDWVVQEEAVSEAGKAFKVGRIKVDSTGVGDPVFDRLRFLGLPVEPVLFTNESKYQLLTHLALGIERHQLAYPNIPIMLRELKSLRAAHLPSGRSRIEAPPGSHDDYPMSLAMAYSLCDPPPAEMNVWAEIHPSRYAPAVDTTVPGGIIERELRRRSWQQWRREQKGEARRKALTLQGFEM